MVDIYVYGWSGRIIEKIRVGVALALGGLYKV